jgi:hypothetical protein
MRRARREKEAEERAQQDSVAELRRERSVIAALGARFDSVWATAVPFQQLDTPPKLTSGESGPLSVPSASGSVTTIMFVVGADGHVSAARIRDNTDLVFASTAILAVAARVYTPGTHLGKAVPARMQQVIMAR